MGHYIFTSPKRLILTILLAVGAWFGYQFISKEKKPKPDSEQTTDSHKKNAGADSTAITKKDTTTHKPVVVPPTVNKPDNAPVVVNPEEKKPTDVVISPKQPEKVVPVVKQPVTKTTTPVVKKKPAGKKTEPKKKKDTRENLDIKF